jgi:hypothetical protein
MTEIWIFWVEYKGDSLLYAVAASRLIEAEHIFMVESS